MHVNTCENSKILHYKPSSGLLDLKSKMHPSFEVVQFLSDLLNTNGIITLVFCSPGNICIMQNPHYHFMSLACINTSGLYWG